MSTDVTSSVLKEQEILQSRVVALEKEQQFIKKLYSDTPAVLHDIAKSTPISVLLNRFKNNLQTQLSDTYCLFVVCDKECIQWRLQYGDTVNEVLSDANGRLAKLPQALITFAATSSCSSSRETAMQSIMEWSPWHAFLEEHGFNNVSMRSVPDGHGSIHVTLCLESEKTNTDESLISLALDHYVSCIDAAFERQRADFLLLEDSHREPETGLLRRYSFENSFNIVLKDSRRHFQRAALLSLRVLSEEKVENTDLKELADVMRETVRDNDLIARYDERELVMGIRITHIEDAEVVANKVLESLNKVEYRTNTIMRSGLAIGISFYPEHSTLEALHQAAFLAANSLSNTSAYCLELHDAFYDNSSECYSL